LIVTVSVMLLPSLCNKQECAGACGMPKSNGNAPCHSELCCHGSVQRGCKHTS
jgi:hypothetical protein